MNNVVGPIQLGRYLDDNFIIGAGKSLSFWANHFSISPGNLSGILRKKKTITIPNILKFSEAFGLPAETLIRMQNQYLVYSYTEDNKHEAPLPRITSVKLQKLVTDILLYDFMDPMGISFHDLARHTKIKFNTLRQFFYQGRVFYADYDLLCRVGDGLGTGPKFWLDLQSKQDLNFYLEQNPWASKYFDWNPETKFSPGTTTIEINEACPGEILKERYLIPSGISLFFWSDYFCVYSDTFKRILAGKKKMDFRFISLIVKAFQKPASYWIGIQNEYYSHKYLTESAPKLSIGVIASKTIRRKVLTPIGKILIDDFLKPIGMTATEFGRHISGKQHTGLHLLYGDDHIGVKLAVKMSQALGTSPMFWLDLQMEEDLARGTNTKINGITKRKFVTT